MPEENKWKYATDDKMRELMNAILLRAVQDWNMWLDYADDCASIKQWLEVPTHLDRRYSFSSLRKFFHSDYCEQLCDALGHPYKGIVDHLEENLLLRGNETWLK